MSSKSVARRFLATKYIQNYSGTDPSEEGSSTSVINWTDSVEGPSVPNYRHLIATGQNATSSLDGQRTLVELSDGYLLYHFNTNGGVAPGANDRYCRARGNILSNISIPALPSTSTVPIADNVAKVKAYERVNQIYTAFQGGVFLGELSETLRMLRDPAKALRKGIDDYLTGLKKVRHRSRSYKRRYLSESWLEYSFGWSPLIGDIRDASNYLDKRRRRLEQTLVRFRGFGSNESASFSSFTGLSVGAAGYRWRTRTKTDTTVAYYGAVKSRASGTHSVDADLLGFTPRSFAPTAWELIPYSFLVDYFTNIGGVINAWSNQNTDFAWIARTVRRSSVRETVDAHKNFTTSSDYLIYHQTFSPGYWRVTNTAVNRASLNSLGIPSVQFELPGFGLKWLNLGALARTHRSLTPFF